MGYRPIERPKSNQNCIYENQRAQRVTEIGIWIGTCDPAINFAQTDIEAHTDGRI